MRIGILTGGGDAPGLNAVIRGVVVRATQLGHQVVGIRRGWKGVVEADAFDLRPEMVESIQREGGTILKTSRTNPVKDDTTKQKAIAGYKKLKLDCLVAVGGDDTLGACAKLAKEGINAVGVPKTIDNDLSGTDVTFGFDTAANIAAQAIDHLHTTAESHERCLVVEVMGRHAGWITWAAGIAGGAHVILLPEEPYDIDEVCKVVTDRDKAGKGYTIVAVSEGAQPKGGNLVTQSGEKDQFGNVRLGGIAERLAKEIETKTKKETRHVVLGHLQRAGPPSAFDRVYGTRLGVMAAELANEKKFGMMVALKGTDIHAVPIQEAAKGYRLVPPKAVELVRVLRGT
jgi:ATP-dependent phosphofructokinase / diphosphate-dependent phosphofructokinase